MTPLVSDDHGAFERKQVGRDEGLEKEWIGHPGDTGRLVVQIENGAFRASRPCRDTRPDDCLCSSERVCKLRVDNDAIKTSIGMGRAIETIECVDRSLSQLPRWSFVALPDHEHAVAAIG